MGGNRRIQRKCKYCGVFVVRHTTAIFCNTAICWNTKISSNKETNKTRVFTSNRAEVNTYAIYTRAQRTDIRSTLLPSNGRVQYGYSPLLGQASDQVFLWNGLLHCPVMETFYGRQCRNQPKPCDWQMKCVCGDIQLYFMATVDIEEMMMNKQRAVCWVVEQQWHANNFKM